MPYHEKKDDGGNGEQRQTDPEREKDLPSYFDLPGEQRDPDGPDDPDDPDGPDDPDDAGAIVTITPVDIEIREDFGLSAEQISGFAYDENYSSYGNIFANVLMNYYLATSGISLDDVEFEEVEETDTDTDVETEIFTIDEVIDILKDKGTPSESYTILQDLGYSAEMQQQILDSIIQTGLQDIKTFVAVMENTSYKGFNIDEILDVTEQFGVIETYVNNGFTYTQAIKTESALGSYSNMSTSLVSVMGVMESNNATGNDYNISTTAAAVQLTDYVKDFQSFSATQYASVTELGSSVVEFGKLAVGVSSFIGM